MAIKWDDEAAPAPTAAKGIKWDEPAKEPSFFAKAAKYVGETGADIATNYATLGGAVNPVVAGVGALGSYLQPDTKSGGGSLGERYQREMRNLRGREEEAQTRSPTTAPAATLAGFLALPMSGAAMSPTSTAVAGIAEKTLPAAAVKVLAGTNDAAAMNALTKGLANADSPEAFSQGFDEGLNDPTKYAAGVLGPIAQEVAPWAVVKAQRAEDRASQAASRLFRTGPDSTKIMEQRMGQGLHDPLAAQTLAGEVIRSRPDLIRSPLNERAGAAGALLEDSSRTLAKVRELAEPRALVDYKPYFARLRAIRDELVGSAAARTSDEGKAAATYIDSLIASREAEFVAKARETGQKVDFVPGQGEIGETATTTTYPGRPGLRAGEPTEVVAVSRELPGASVVEPPPRRSNLPRSIELQSELRNEKGQIVRQGRFATNRQGTVAPPGYEQPMAGEMPPSQPRSVAEAGGTPETARLQGGQGGENPIMQPQLDPAFYGEQPPLFVDDATGRPMTPEEGGVRYQGTNRPNPDAPVHVNLKHAEAVPHPGTPETATQLNLFPDRAAPELKTTPGEMITENKGLPLSEWTKLKSWDQETAHTTSSGAPRPEESIDQSLKLEFLKRAGGAAKEAEESAIAGAFHPIAPGAKISRGVSGTSWQPERPLGRSISIGEPDKFSGIRTADRTPLARAREAVEKTLAFKQAKSDFSVAETLLPNAQELQRMTPEQLRDLERSYSPRGAFWHWVFKKVTPGDPQLVKMNELLAKGMRTGAKGDYQAVADRQSIMALVNRLRSETKEREDAP
jgi:hypothetical protein